jgi:hypothetical protein
MGSNKIYSLLELEFNMLKWGGFVSTKNQKINERRLSLDILGL